VRNAPQDVLRGATKRRESKLIQVATPTTPTRLNLTQLKGPNVK